MNIYCGWDSDLKIVFWNCNDKKSSESVFIEKYLGKAEHRQWDVIVYVAIF